MKNHNSQTVKKSSLFTVFFGLSVVTLYFNPGIQDPFNAPKMWVLMFIASWCLGFLVVYCEDIKNIFRTRNSKFFPLLIVFIFLMSSFISTIMTNVQITAFFGENQRRNGFLTTLSLVIIFVFVLLNASIENFSKIYFVTFLISIIIFSYALMQNNGKDFIKWNNPYNSIIGTLGNPNFAAALMAILSAILAGAIFDHRINLIKKFLFGLTIIGLLYAIVLSNARQGILTAMLGIGVVTIVFLFTKSRFLGFLGIGIGIISGFLAILGMLQKGPLAASLYKGSVSVRGYYWRAGLEMFQSHPFFGVGTDRYGAYFKEFREVNYPLSYGFDLTSTNAHNLPIQIFATNGFFCGASYLILIGFIFITGVKLIQEIETSGKWLAVSIFAGWMAYQAQSLISIDNIGLSIWGWVLGAAILGLSAREKSGLERQSRSLRSRQQLELVQPVVSASLVLLSIFLISFLYQGEKNMFLTRMAYNTTSSAQNETLKKAAMSTIDTPLVEPFYRLMSADFLYSKGYKTEGMEELEKLLKNDPRNLDYLLALVNFVESERNFEKSIILRKQIRIYDPWNAKNILQLANAYKAMNENEKTNELLREILKFAPQTPEGTQAKIELTSG